MPRGKSFRNDFGELLLKTVIPENAGIEEKNTLVQSLNNFVVPKFPKSLFRYRSFDKDGYALNALKTNRLYFSKPAGFNDPHDCLVYIDFKSVEESIRNVNKKQLMQQADEFLSNGIVPPEYSQYLSRADRRRLKNSKTAKKYKANDIAKLIADPHSELYNQFVSQVLGDMRDLALWFKTQPNIACLSETVTASQMWGYYSDSHTGFAVEYETKNFATRCIQCDKVAQCEKCFWLNCYPIIYKKERFDATSYATAFAQRELFKKASTKGSPIVLPDELIFIKANIFKDTVWQHEREWRLWLNCKKDNHFIEIRPKAIYLGCRIHSDKKALILQAAKDIGCEDVYQMNEQFLCKDYGMGFTKIDM